MKQLTLIKPTAHIQIGHLYEHLYCIALQEFFRRHHLYAYLDYSIDAKTFDDGYIQLEVDLYTERAGELEQAIYSLPLSLTPDEIDGALLQISAEKEVDIKYLDTNIVDRALLDLHRLPWSERSDTLVSTFAWQTKTEEGLGYDSAHSSGYDSLVQSIRFTMTNDDPAYSLALFAVISQVIATNLREVIANHCYCYSQSDSFSLEGYGAEERNIYRIDKRQADRLTNEIEVTSSFIRGAFNNRFINKLVTFLEQASAEPFMAPDPDDILSKTGVKMSLEDWHRFGTVENIHAIIRKMSITFSLGDTVQSIGLAELLERKEAAPLFY